MKRVLILTASTGGGHNSAAQSLQEKYEEKGYKAYKVDFLKETSRVMNTLISDGYEFMAHSLPTLYGALYNIVDRKSFNTISRAGYYAIEKRIKKIILEIDPDVIIATHAFGVGIVSRLKAKNKISCDFISVITDFNVHYSYISPFVDAYITGSEYTKNEMIKRGLPAYKIYPYGIPVRKPFQEKAEPKFMDSNQNETFRVLVMGGSMGSKDIEMAVSVLCDKLNDCFIEVVCGRNDTLKSAIEKRHRSSIYRGQMKIHGFTKHIPEMMDQADIIITKPGGLTTTEALLKRLPMIVPFAIPGQEEKNIDFLIAEGIALRVNELGNLPDQITYLREHPEKYNEMVHNMKRISDNYSIDKIVDLTNDLINRRLAVSAPIVS